MDVYSIMGTFYKIYVISFFSTCILFIQLSEAFREKGKSLFFIKGEIDEEHDDLFC